MNPAPKDLKANARYRKAILQRAKNDTEFQRELWIRCSRGVEGFIYWADTFCIAAGTLVVTERGLVPIESVTPADKVWDGDNWVSQGGAIYQGCKYVIFKYGIHLTPDHKVWTKHGWKDASEGYGRQAVRLPDGYRKKWPISGNEIGGVDQSRANGRPTSNSGGQRKEIVYDLLNCGPKRAFTVLDQNGRPLLVHNCCTYDPKTYPSCPNRLFVLHKYQEDGARKILSAVGVHDILIEKSRQMGVSWLVVAIFVWLWLFRGGQSFLLGSRKEALIDKPGDSAALFYKIDYIVERLPRWMRPEYERTSQHYLNSNNESTIDGESTNDNFGRGSTKTAIELDEFQAVDNGQRIQDSTQAATRCRIFVGTPAGASGAYFDQRQKMLETTPDRVLRFHWSLNPVYAAGLYSIEGCDKGKPPTIIDTSYQFPPDFNFLHVTYPQFKLRSPWFNEECIRATSAQKIASEYEIDYLQSGWQFFDPTKLHELLSDPEVVMPPLRRGELIRDPDWKSPQWVEQSGGDHRGGGRLLLWFPPTQDGKVIESWDDVVIGCDIASGSGGEMSSNSSASIARRSTGEKIGELTDNLINPHDFALYCLALCKWFNNAFLIFERNGPNGAQFSKVVKDSGYRNIFYPVKELRTDFVSKKEPGWWSDPETKPILLGSYAEALWTRSFINHSEIALKECGHYVQNGNKIEHNRSLASATEDPTAIGESHADRVIADALANRGMAAITVAEKEAPDPEPPPNSFGGRRKAWERQQENRPLWGVLR